MELAVVGWGYGQSAGRDVGYGVRATCDKRGCEAEIDRGLGYVCGDFAEGMNQTGCGWFFCGQHLAYVGPRQTQCQHTRNGQRQPWGRVLSCMVLNPQRDRVCLDRVEHRGQHAWATERAA